MSEKMKKKIAAKLMEMVCETRDLTQVSVYELADELKISRTSFYRNFRDKFDVVDWIFERIVVDPVNSDQLEDTYAARVLLSLEVISEHKVFFQSVMRYHGQNAFEQSYFSCISQDFQKRYRSRFPEVSDSFFVSWIEFYTAGIVRIVSKWLQDDCRESPQEVTDKLARIVEGSFIS